VKWLQEEYKRKLKVALIQNSHPVTEEEFEHPEILDPGLLPGHDEGNSGEDSSVIS
jgi:hypothetical protein